jgi:hypothetical protein
MKQTWYQTLVVQQVDGNALNTSTTPTSVIAPAAKITLPAGFIDQPGIKIMARVMGRLSNINPTPGTLTLDLKFGGTSVASSGALALNTAAAKTNVTFVAICEATVRIIGTAAQLMYTWQVTSEAVALAATGVGIVYGPASAPAVGTAFDSTAAQTVDVFGTFSVSNIGNNIQLHEYELGWKN